MYNNYQQEENENVLEKYGRDIVEELFPVGEEGGKKIEQQAFVV